MTIAQTIKDIEKEIDLNTKKDILIVIGKAEQELSKITRDLSVCHKEPFIAHLLISVGFLRDSIHELSKSIIKESKI